MTRLLLLLVVVAAVVAVVAIVRARREAEVERRRRASAPRRDPLAPDPHTVDVRSVGVGAVVSYGGRDFVVRGSLVLDQDGFRWHEHLLDDADVRRWLSVEDDEELEVALWEARPAHGIEPGGQVIEYEGVTYELDEHGKATFTAEGTTGTGPTGHVEYWDYAAGDRLLSFERFGSGDVELGVGQRLPESAIDVYPASRQP